MKFPCRLLPLLSEFTCLELKIFLTTLINWKNERGKNFPRIEQFAKKNGDSFGGLWYKTIKLAGKRIMSRTAELDNKKNKIHIRHFIKYFTINKGTVESEFDERLLEVIEQNKARSKYLQIKLKNILALKSAYSIRLYLYVLSLDFMERRITIDELSTQIGAHGFKRERKILEVLRGAVKEVNVRTDIKISIEECRIGKGLKDLVINSKRIDEGPALERWFNSSELEYLQERWPMEYLRFCEKIVEKIYDPKRGSRIAIFNTVADRGFSAWRVQQSAMRATMEKNILFRIEQERKRPVTKKQVAQVMRSLKEVPEWLERFNQKHGITKT